MVALSLLGYSQLKLDTTLLGVQSYIYILFERLAAPQWPSCRIGNSLNVRYRHSGEECRISPSFSVAWAVSRNKLKVCSDRVIESIPLRLWELPSIFIRQTNLKVKWQADEPVLQFHGCSQSSVSQISASKNSNPQSQDHWVTRIQTLFTVNGVVHVNLQRLTLLGETSQSNL